MHHVYCQEFDKSLCIGSRGPTATPPGHEERPRHCFCEERSKAVQTVNPYSPNVGRFFLVCRQNPLCRFFQFLDQPWTDPIFTNRLEEARRRGWAWGREEKSSWLAEVDEKLDHQPRPRRARRKVSVGARKIMRESRECWPIRNTNTCVNKKS